MLLLGFVVMCVEETAVAEVGLLCSEELRAGRLPASPEARNNHLIAGRRGLESIKHSGVTVHLGGDLMIFYRLLAGSIGIFMTNIIAINYASYRSCVSHKR